MALESESPTESPANLRPAGVHETGSRLRGDLSALSDDSVPTSLREEDGAIRIFGIHVVVLLIVGLSLCFIAFIAWQISQMPEPVN